MFFQWRNKLLKVDTDSVFNGRVTTESNGLSCCTEQTDDSQVWLCGGHMMVSINISSGSVAINIALIYRARGARCTLLSNAQQWFLYMFLPLFFSWNHRKYRLCSNHTSDFGCQSRENTVRFMWLLRSLMKTDVVSYLPLWQPSAFPLPVAQWWGLLWIL